MTSSDEFGQSLLKGLLADPKFALPKWFYDERGSALFDQICDAEDYYPTRTENAILATAAEEIVGSVGDRHVLLEPGAGSAFKIRHLLNVDHTIEAYVPLDISGDHLEANAATLRRDFPDLAVIPATGDFSKPINLPDIVPPHVPVVIFFPGSTIGNFEPHEAAALLRRFADVPHTRHLILGADLRKDEARLRRAYDDSEGVTAAFNRNLLVRANRELKADFDFEAFRHQVRYDRERHRIEMHLESQRSQVMHLLGHEIRFAPGETIHTENSYKYDEASLVALTGPAGWSLRKHWYDEEDLFGVFLFDRD